MTKEEAAELLEAFRRDSNDVPSLDPSAIAYAYLKVLGSMAPERGDAFSR